MGNFPTRHQQRPSHYLPTSCIYCLQPCLFWFKSLVSPRAQSLTHLLHTVPRGDFFKKTRHDVLVFALIAWTGLWCQACSCPGVKCPHWWKGVFFYQENFCLLVKAALEKTLTGIFCSRNFTKLLFDFCPRLNTSCIQVRNNFMRPTVCHSPNMK